MDCWNVSVEKAIAIQRELAKQLLIGGRPKTLQQVAGVDLAYDARTRLSFCAIVVFSYPQLNIIATHYEHDTIAYPYIPGLLTFREGPLFLRLYQKMEHKPDLLLFDGQGIAHPRKMGIAAHMGVLLQMPTIGCAKSRLYGSYKEPAEEKGSKTPLYDTDGNRIGMVLRTRSGVKPVIVSPGNMIGIDEAAEIVMTCCSKYRLPEPTRIADQKVALYKKDVLASLRKQV